jgi:DNA-binding transcriptional ArsR family regulator
MPGMAATLAEAADAAHVAQALAHPLRLRIFFEYHRATTSPSRIARRIGVPLNVVAYHTNALKRLGCVEQTRVERRRGVIERFLRAAAPPLLEDRDVRVPPKVRRNLIRSTIALVAADATRAATQGGFDGAAAHVSRSPLRLDAEGAEALAGLLRRLLEDVGRLEDESAARGGEGVARELVLLCFDDPSAVAAD